MNETMATEVENAARMHFSTGTVQCVDKVQPRVYLSPLAQVRHVCRDLCVLIIPEKQRTHDFFSRKKPSSCAELEGRMEVCRLSMMQSVSLSVTAKEFFDSQKPKKKGKKHVNCPTKPAGS